MSGSERVALLRQRVKRRVAGGSLSVEMAIIAPILFFLLFGIIEMGLLFKDALVLNSACREAARTVSVGALPGAARARALEAAATLDTGGIAAALSFRTLAQGGTWNGWQVLGDGGTGLNDAPTGAQVRAVLSYPHVLITHGLFGSLVNDPEHNAMNIGATMVMRRE